MIKNIVKVFFSNALLALVGLVNSFIFPIILSVSEYAYYQEYVLYISYLNICHLGIASGMFLNYAGHSYKETDKCQYKSEIFLIYMVLCIFSFIGLLVTGITTSKMLLYVVLTIFPQGIIASFQALYQAWGRFTEYSIVNVLPKFLFTIFIILSSFIVSDINSNYIIILYLIIQWLVTFYFMFEFSIFTKGFKCNSFISKKNKDTIFSGFLIMLGNYVNLLFHSIDKQFVHLLYNTFSFAQYSFAMSTQNIMTIFITAVANPFYPMLTKEYIDGKFISRLKEILFIFGAYSGCAYYGVFFLVKYFIIKYQTSLKVIAMFFVVFPAIAVINVLYINLYKIRKKLKKYIYTLLGMLITACVLNYISVLLKTDYIGIAFATMCTYYIWLFYSQKDFEEISIAKKDIVYLLGYFIIYFSLTMLINNIIGIVIYTVTISVWNYIMYRDTVQYLWTMIRRIKTE